MTLSNFFSIIFDFFYFVVSRCGSTSCTICAWAVCPKSLMFNYLHDSMPTFFDLLSRLAISIALA